MAQEYPTDAKDDIPALGLPTIYTSLPNMIRRRLRPLSSLRRNPGSAKQSPGLYQQHSRAHSQPRSKDLDYYSPSLSTTSTSSCDSTVVGSNEIDLLSLSPDRCASFVTPGERESSINWKFAYEGTALLARSFREAVSHDQHPRLTRRLYVDGLAYLAHGLPKDLDDSEAAQLKHALPAIKGVGTERIAAHSENGRDIRDIRQVHPLRREKRTITYAATTRLVLFLTFFVNLLLPYVRSLLWRAYQCERRYKISERLIANVVSLGGCMWTRSLAFVQDAGDGIHDGIIRQGHHSSNSTHYCRNAPLRSCRAEDEQLSGPNKCLALCCTVPQGDSLVDRELDEKRLAGNGFGSGA